MKDADRIIKSTYDFVCLKYYCGWSIDGIAEELKLPKRVIKRMMGYKTAKECLNKMNSNKSSK